MTKPAAAHKTPHDAKATHHAKVVPHEAKAASPVEEHAAEPLTSDPTKIQGVRRIEEAHALPEVAAGAKNKVFESDDPTHILAFRAEDGRIMRVVHTASGLAARPDAIHTEGT